MPAITRSNPYTSGLVIENPAMTVEYILRSFFGLDYTKIDTDSFDTVGTSTSGMKLAASIQTQKSGIEHINRILFEFNLQLFLTTTGKYKIVNMGSGSGNATSTISNSDIFMDLNGPLITVSKSSVLGIYNNIYLNYRQDYSRGTDIYQGYKYIGVIDEGVSASTNMSSSTGALRNTTYHGWMQQSRDVYRTGKNLELNLEFVRDNTTADIVLKRFADYYAFRRMIVTATLLKMETAMKLELGDLVKFNNRLLGTLHANIADFMITRINYAPVNVEGIPVIQIEAQEVPFSRTGDTVDNSAVPVEQ